MNIYGISAESPLAQQISVWSKEQKGVREYRGVPALITARFSEVYLMQKGSEENFRPYLLLVGAVRSAKFAEDAPKMPYGIDGVTFGTSGTEIIYRYQFSDDELKELVDKGYFSTTPPDVPSIFTGASFEELPMPIDRLLILPPDAAKEYDGDNPPLVVVDFGDLTNCVTDQVESGYRLGSYFEPSPAFVKNAAPVHDEVEEVVEAEPPEEMFSLDEEPETDKQVEERLYEATVAKRTVEPVAEADEEETSEKTPEELAAQMLAEERRRKKAAADRLAEELATAKPEPVVEEEPLAPDDGYI